MFKLILRPRYDSDNTYPSDITILQTEDGHLSIDLGDRRIEVDKNDISKLSKLLDLSQ
jgi:hypothetical protein